MNIINSNTIIPIICCLLSLACGIFVLINNRKARLNQLLFLLCLNLSIWMTQYVPMFLNTPHNILILYFKVTYCFIAFIPIMKLTFVTTFINNNKNNQWFIFNLVIGIIFCLLCLFSDLIMGGAIFYENHSYPKAGKLHALFVIHCLYLATVCIYLINKELVNKTIDYKKSNQLRYFKGAIFTLMCGAIDFIGNYNIQNPIIGYYSTTIFVFIITIAIIKHNLIDIKIVIHQGLLYSILVSSITVIFFISVYISEKALHNIFGYTTFASSVFTATIVAISFIPLRNFIQKLIEKTFFKGSYIEIAQENNLLKQELIRSERMRMVATLASGLAT